MTKHIYPETLTGLNINSQAEANLFDEFRTQLSDHFHIYYSVNWLGIRRIGRQKSDGEVDFIILHPKMGILLLEVKGGIIGHNGFSGFFTENRNGDVFSIKDPIQQVKTNKYALLSLIDSLPNWQGKIPTIGHAVAFPDGTIDIDFLGLDIPREIVLLHEDLLNLEAWLRNCFNFWKGEANRFVPPTDVTVEALDLIFRKSWEMREPKLGERIPSQLTRLKRYTTEQFIVLDTLTCNKKALIRGCAGSGKTLLALEKAKRLASEGLNTLLTCYNRNLADYLRLAAGNYPRLRIQNFHGLCQEYISRAGLDQSLQWERDRNRTDFFETVMPEMLIEAMVQLDEKAKPFDAIIVDEGQDFSSTWWSSLESLLADLDDGIFYIFYDDNQLVYGKNLILPDFPGPFSLSRNCRNTAEIHEIVKRFYHSDLNIIPSEISGKPVEIHTYVNNPKNLTAKLTEILARLVYSDNVKYEDIVLLSPAGKTQLPFSEMETVGPFHLQDQYEKNTEGIFSTSIRLFKGLESPVVIMVIPQNSQALDSLLYVGLSRAITTLIILIDEKVAPNYFPE
jgi:nuclease-like protein